MASQSATVIRRQRPTSQFVSVEDTPNGGGSAQLLSTKAKSRSPHLRPVSSFYSIPEEPDSKRSSAMPQAGYDNRASSIYPPTISPPDSPRTTDGDNSSQPNISPISTVAPSQPWSRPTHIPQPRKPAGGALAPPTGPASKQGWRDAVRTIGRSASPGQPQQKPEVDKIDTSEPTRWDTYSGERSQNGKPASASPTAHPYTGTDAAFGYSAHITGGSAKPSHFLGVKLRKAVDRQTPPRPQEPWRSASGVQGPSGRAATIDPMTDAAVPADIKRFPTPAERRARGLFQKSGNTGRTSPGPAIGLGIRSGTPTGQRNTQPEEKTGGLRVFTGALDSVREAASNAATSMRQYNRDKSPDPRRPETSVPDGPIGEVVVNQTMRYKYRLGDSSREQSPITPTYHHGYPGLEHQSSEGMLRNNFVQQGGRSFTAPITESPATYGLPSNQYHIPPRKDSRPFNGTSSSDDFDPHQLTAAFRSMGYANEPKSHFSATTYNTSNADSTPPETPRVPGMDDVPPLPVPAQEISILNRKRPVPSASNQFRAKPPSRKPTPMQGEAALLAEEVPAEPPKPVSRVQELEDKLKSLNNRKISLGQMIHELTNVVHPSSVHYDMASREEIKKSVARMKTEFDIVTSEIQETGIKLHRAYRKRDEVEGEGGGLWVRRVTE